jgi:hypothetical protein
MLRLLRRVGTRVPTSVLVPAVGWRVGVPCCGSEARTKPATFGQETCDAGTHCLFWQALSAPHLVPVGVGSLYPEQPDPPEEHQTTSHASLPVESHEQAPVYALLDWRHRSSSVTQPSQLQVPPEMERPPSVFEHWVPI